MTSSRVRIAPHVQAFFPEHLCHQKRLSPPTIASGRDPFRLVFPFSKETAGIAPSTLRVTALDAPLVRRLLDDLEHHRGPAVRSRTMRLSALRPFLRFVSLREPERIAIATRVRAIPLTRADKKLVGYLPRADREVLRAAPDRARGVGRRAHALVLTLDNRGARLSEVTTLRREQVSGGPTTLLHLHGTGRKDRTVPVWPQTRQVLQGWLRELGAWGTPMVFPNARGKPLSRYGVNSLLQQALDKARGTCPSLGVKTVSPHGLRHATALQLLQSGVDITVMALWLGHESIETPQVYWEADLATTERALPKLTPGDVPLARFTADDPLLAFLASL